MRGSAAGRAGRTALACLLLLVLGVVGGCRSGDPGTPTTPSASASPTIGPRPSWAVPVKESGTLLGRIGDSRVRIDVRQVGVVASPADSVMVDPRTGAPVIRRGDKLVLLRYVVTNVSSDPLRLGLGTVTVRARYPDWSFAQDLVGIRDPRWQQRHGIAATPFVADPGRPPYVLAPGESFMVGMNAPYEKAEELQVTAEVVIADESGTVDPGLSWTITGSVHLT